jgi:CSLREA domain-containing protein
MRASANTFKTAAMVSAALLAAVLVAVLMSSGPALAQPNGVNVITVNTDEDELNTDGDCSLREAITAADTNAAVDGCDAGSATGRDAIHFSLGPEATIVLASELPPVTDASGLNINGMMAKITVSGDESVRVLQEEAGAKLTLHNLTVADGNAGSSTGVFGGGVFNNGGTLKVDHSTFTGNSAVFGGGIQTFNGTLKVINSTLSGNNNGGNFSGSGGIHNNNGTLNVISSTFSNNGVRNDGGTTALGNTILANVPTGNNCVGTVTDDGYNISDDGSCNFTETTSKNSTDPKLASSLANNGGPTQTIALLKGSPALNAIPKGQNGCGTEIKTDQRGVMRPQGKKCDIGAFEKKQ